MSAPLQPGVAPSTDAEVWALIVRGIKGKHEMLRNYERYARDSVVPMFDDDMLPTQRMYGNIGGNQLIQGAGPANNDRESLSGSQFPTQQWYGRATETYGTDEEGIHGSGLECPTCHGSGLMDYLSSGLKYLSSLWGSKSKPAPASSSGTFPSRPPSRTQPSASLPKKKEEKKEEPDLRTPEEILGVARGASPSEIKRAYFKKSKEHHPDRGGKTEEFQKIANAKDVLLRGHGLCDCNQCDGDGCADCHGSGFMDYLSKGLKFISSMWGPKDYVAKERVKNPATQAAMEQLLGVSPGATSSEVLKAFRRMSLKYHPDKGGDPEVYKKLAGAKDYLIGHGMHECRCCKGSGLRGGQLTEAQSQSLVANRLVHLKAVSDWHQQQGTMDTAAAGVGPDSEGLNPVEGAPINGATYTPIHSTGAKEAILTCIDSLVRSTVGPGSSASNMSQNAAVLRRTVANTGWKLGLSDIQAVIKMADEADKHLSSGPYPNPNRYKVALDALYATKAALTVARKLIEEGPAAGVPDSVKKSAYDQGINILSSHGWPTDNDELVYEAAKKAVFEYHGFAPYHVQATVPTGVVPVSVEAAAPGVFPIPPTAPATAPATATAPAPSPLPTRTSTRTSKSTDLSIQDGLHKVTDAIAYIQSRPYDPEKKKEELFLLLEYLVQPETSTDVDYLEGYKDDPEEGILDTYRNETRISATGVPSKYHKTPSQFVANVNAFFAERRAVNDKKVKPSTPDKGSTSEPKVSPTKQRELDQRRVDVQKAEAFKKSGGVRALIGVDGKAKEAFQWLLTRGFIAADKQHSFVQGETKVAEVKGWISIPIPSA